MKTLVRSGPEILKLFSYSTQLSMKFQLLIKTKMLKNKDFSCFQTVQCCIYPGVIKFRITQDFLIELSCILHIRSNLLLLLFVIRTYHDLFIRYLLYDKLKQNAFYGCFVLLNILLVISEHFWPSSRLN